VNATTTSRTRATRRIAAIAAGAIGTLCLLGSPGASLDRAEAALTNNVPRHQIGQWFYDGYGLGVNPPRSMRPFNNVNCRNGELVKWSPDLYRWNGRRWVLYNGSAPWYYAVTSIYGYCQVYYSMAWNSPSGMGVYFHRFGPLPRGWYAIKNYMYWPKLNRNHAHWSDTFRVS
jgi:hypothetical protein